MSVRNCKNKRGCTILRILDPVHKYILFSDKEAALIDSVFLQRLRYIRQLGFAEYAFPGAVHSRFLHSLGVCYLAGKAFDALFKSKSSQLLSSQKKKEFRQMIRLAALLHDIGHGPLSHISEEAMPLLKNLPLPYAPLKNRGNATHEHYTIKFLLESELKHKIEAMDIDPWHVAHLIDDDVPLSDPDYFISNGVDFRPVLKQIVSSDLDVDRMDYLQRDSFFCGTDYGFCDHDWILNNLQVYIYKDQAFMGVGQKAVYSVESFFLGRRHMGIAVYFHNKMVAMDEMLHCYFKSENCEFRIPLCLKDYLYYTDVFLFEHLRSVAHKNEWAKRIIKKQPYKKVYEVRTTDQEKEIQFEKLYKVKEKLKKQGIPYVNTNSSDHIKYFVQERANHQIYIVDETTGSAVRLQDRMEMFHRTENVILINRIYVSPEDENKIHKGQLLI